MKDRGESFGNVICLRPSARVCSFATIPCVPRIIPSTLKQTQLLRWSTIFKAVPAGNFSVHPIALPQVAFINRKELAASGALAVDDTAAGPIGKRFQEGTFEKKPTTKSAAATRPQTPMLHLRDVSFLHPG